MVKLGKKPDNYIWLKWTLSTNPWMNEWYFKIIVTIEILFILFILLIDWLIDL